MARRKRMSEGKKNIIAALLQEYDIQSAEDIQDALKDLLGDTIKEMMEAEMDEHLGYESYERSENPNSRNGYKQKQIRSKYGETTLSVPQDRDSTFEPKIVKKCQKDISAIDDKIISMYAKITYAASLRITLLSFTEKWTASIKRIEYTSARGLFCHSSISGKRRSVISETMPSLTSKP